jgi:Uma2 family endonuclease
MERMGDPALAQHERFTYRNYKTWPDEERWELIDGQAWSMSPAPTMRHQELLGRLHMIFANFLIGKPSRVFFAPFDVLLPQGEEADDDIDTVVQPDLLVYCNTSKLTKAGSRGAPDLIAEILSPSTSKKDQREKFDLFERHGVREYWIIDPTGKWLCRYALGAEGSYDAGELREEGRAYGSIASIVLVGLTIEPKALFAELE